MNKGQFSRELLRSVNEAESQTYKDRREVIRKDITDMFEDGRATAWIDKTEVTPILRSPYHFIRHTTHGTTAPFINMPLGQTRVYVERIG